MSGKTFSRSMFASSKDLFEAKAEYYERELKLAKILLMDLVDRCKNEVPDIEDCGDVQMAIEYLKGDTP